jgi:hypothetical protein
MGPDCRRAAGWTGLWSTAIVRCAPLLNRQGWDLVRVGFRLADEAREPLKKLLKMRRASLHSSSASSSSKRYVGGRPTAIVVPNSEIALLARRDYILDPAGRKGAAHPSELYGLTNNEIAHFGAYRTASLILQPWDCWNGRRCCGRFGPRQRSRLRARVRRVMKPDLPGIPADHEFLTFL